MDTSPSMSASSGGVVTMSPDSATSTPAIKQEHIMLNKKRPGPKRDAKPAQSEKLQRNRQAQRTHRERKEQYTKDLEAEVMRLKEIFVNISHERDAASRARDDAISERNHLLDENQRLRSRLDMSASTNGTDSAYSGFPTSGLPTRTNSVCMSDEPSKISPSTTFVGCAVPDESSNKPPGHAWEESQSRCAASSWTIVDAKPATETPSDSQPTPNATILTAPIDYDELGLDFVLTLERPCMTHLQYLTVRAHNCQVSEDHEMGGQPMEVPDDGENQHISGHALMFTAPPPSHIQENPGARYPSELPKVQREDLLKLLDLSSQLQVNEPELPPVKAWIRLMQDERFWGLSGEDLATLKKVLLGKVHCYRFGAVVEEADIIGALQEVLDGKGKGSPASASNSSPCAVKQG
ncbi:hypothetical protein TI39_contig4278g00015 [Zymoseptoria brevis]|uniref:BZIP domain-containing protein n=1 Tax=Zymoseptoria brevis TaxID=1047168 RepID=A0A0F4G8F4_9PEZI|nr:hypothetical protein TI39_contig4278g00015 [Zymoseptoria brevis]